MSNKKRRDEYYFKKFPMNIYKHGVGVFFGNFDSLIKKLNNLGFKGTFNEEKELAEKSAGITFSLSTDDIMIWMPHKPKTNGDTATLAHEIFHATSFLLRGVGINHTPDTEEAYAYAFTHLYFNIISWVYS